MLLIHKVTSFSDSSLVPDLDKNDFNAEICKHLEKSEGVDELQFVVRAFSSSQQGGISSTVNSFIN